MTIRILKHLNKLHNYNTQTVFVVSHQGFEWAQLWGAQDFS